MSLWQWQGAGEPDTTHLALRERQPPWMTSIPSSNGRGGHFMFFHCGCLRATLCPEIFLVTLWSRPDSFGEFGKLFIVIQPRPTSAGGFVSSAIAAQKKLWHCCKLQTYKCRHRDFKYVYICMFLCHIGSLWDIHFNQMATSVMELLCYTSKDWRDGAGWRVQGYTVHFGNTLSPISLPTSVLNRLN